VRARVGLLAVVGALACAAPAGAQSVTVSCDSFGGRDSCNHWYRTSPVILDWSWNPAAITTNGCGGGTFTAEGRVARSCTVQWPGTTTTKDIWIGIDRTPPTFVSLRAGRPPNANGWFNRPVALSFVGDDRGSGVASCSSTTYSGPEGAGMPVNGRCSDVAGNVRTGSLPINYDSTAPERPAVEALPGNKLVSLEWSAPGDVLAEVVRTRKGGKAALVFHGASHHLTDHRLHNGRRYRYVVTLIDQAGNRSADAASSVPTSSPLLLPARGAHLRNAPRLVWKPVRRASYYNAQLFHGDRKLLTRWPRMPHLQLRSLAAGHYCWYVWPAFGERSERRYGHLLGKSCFTELRG
jgi:hypothetical protein